MEYLRKCDPNSFLISTSSMRGLGYLKIWCLCRLGGSARFICQCVALVLRLMHSSGLSFFCSVCHFLQVIWLQLLMLQRLNGKSYRYVASLALRVFLFEIVAVLLLRIFRACVVIRANGWNSDHPEKGMVGQSVNSVRSWWAGELHCCER